mmetsp:Transcript_41582/g.115718  ORF Transcript_41582/g.115718 Transcript_41582/m.115718 type:complete len:240 (-) Transcript_41582:1153-1872(-)
MLLDHRDVPVAHVRKPVKLPENLQLSVINPEHVFGLRCPSQLDQPHEKLVQVHQASVAAIQKPEECTSLIRAHAHLFAEVRMLLEASLEVFYREHACAVAVQLMEDLTHFLRVSLQVREQLMLHKCVVTMCNAKETANEHTTDEVQEAQDHREDESQEDCARHCAPRVAGGEQRRQDPGSPRDASEQHHVQGQHAARHRAEEAPQPSRLLGFLLLFLHQAWATAIAAEAAQDAGKENGD